MRRPRAFWLRRQWSPTKVRKRLTVAWPMIVAAMLALSGCATTWSRVATSDADFNRDNHACQHMNTQTVLVSSVLARDYVAVYGYKRCMIEEGYTEGGIWKGYSGWRND